MRILFMGTPDFAVPSLESLVAAGHTVCGVFTQPDKPRNRGMKLQAPPVKVCALAHNIPVYQPVKAMKPTQTATLRLIVCIWKRSRIFSPAMEKFMNQSCP